MVTAVHWFNIDPNEFSYRPAPLNRGVLGCWTSQISTQNLDSKLALGTLESAKSEQEKPFWKIEQKEMADFF